MFRINVKPSKRIDTILRLKPMVVKSRMSDKVLVAFDFDHTILEENSDVSVRRLAPGGKLPTEIKSMYKDNDWTEYMAAIFKHIHSHGTTPENIRNLMYNLPLVDGMPELFQHLSSDRYESIIISDANSVFIEYIMTNSGFHDTISKTYTNPAWFDESGCLHIKYYHTQDWCDLSTRNLCKGWILENHIKENSNAVNYKTVVYVGDGSNDLCPALTLRKQDYVLPRKGFKLLKMINENEYGLKAQVKPWTNGHDILDILREIDT